MAVIDVRAARHELSMLRGHTDTPALHYWDVAALIALDWCRSGNALPLSAERLHVRTVGALEVQAYQEAQGRARAALWESAGSVAALAGATPADRDAVMAVLQVWAVTEDEDRWAAGLPACDGRCSPAPDPWSQIGHLRDCPRGAAWRARFRPGWSW